MTAQKLLSQISALFRERRWEDGTHGTTIDDLLVVQSLDRTAPDGVLYDPSVCLVLQGAKEVQTGGRTLKIQAGQSAIISHVSPVVSRVTEASRDKPYTALVLSLDVQILRSLANEISEVSDATAPARAITTGDTDQKLVDNCLKLFELRDDPVQLKVVGPLVRREIHFHLLAADHGGVLRQLLGSKSKASRIALVMAHLRRDFAGRFTVAELADMAGMSVSTFHEHFKDMTGLSPLQFQKELRLLEARNLLCASDQSISMVAFAVGYESANHFSRDYVRKFGRTPSEERRADA